jgi:hypothetical protein
MAIFLLLVLIQSPLQTKALTTPVKEFYADDNDLYKFNFNLDAPLQWTEGSVYAVKVNFTVLELPDEVSGIRIIFIEFLHIGAIGGSSQLLDSSELLPVDQQYRNVDEVHTFEKVMRTPSIVDNFNLNVSIAAVTTGNDTSQDPNNPRKYTYQFPELIQVNRVGARGLVDLYGFPPGSFFFKWLPIVGSFSLAILTPTFISLGYQTKDFLSNRKIRKIKGEKEQNSSNEE